MRPFVKWAGGKTQLLDELQQHLPESFDTYYEPFLGGGAMLLGLKPKNAYVCDINEKLIGTYKQIRDNINGVIDALKPFDASVVTKEVYLARRDMYNHDDSLSRTERAALFIWLNKHAFNGLYRENSKGEFNVPFNNKTHGESFDENNLREISRYFGHFNVNFFVSDFQDFMLRPRQGDFVYVDSPYVPVSPTASFTSYAKAGFDYEDHARLRLTLEDLTYRGVKWMMSNNDVDLVHRWYGGYNIHSVDVRRSINARGNRKSKEVIITNY